MSTESTTGGSRAPFRTAIIGSCVSRDMFNFLDQSAFSFTAYVPRHSVITARNPPRDYRVDLGALTSAFQRRVTDQALHGSTVETIRRATPDLVLWDLTDERTGVYLTPDGPHLTRSVELDASGRTKLIVHHATRHEPSRVLCRFLVMKDGEMPKKYDPEVKARAVRMVREHVRDYGSVTAASVAVGAQLGIARESLRRWVAQAEVDDGARPGVTTAESEEIRWLKGLHHEP
nr:DUF6270 domain-containing protein [Cellulomonas hominis]